MKRLGGRGGLAASLVVAAAVLLVWLLAPRAVSLETANTKGSATAPIEIEEWGDFG
jgi:hypothetical protein